MKSKQLSLAIVVSSLLLFSLHAGDDSIILLPQTSVNCNDRIQLFESINLSQIIDPLTNHTFEELIQETSVQQSAPWHLVAYNIFSSDQLDRRYASKEYFEHIYNSSQGKEAILSADNYTILYDGSHFEINYVNSITNMDIVFALFPEYDN